MSTLTFTPINRHEHDGASDYTLNVKVVEPIYRYELEDCRKEIQSMLNEFLKTPNNELTRHLIKVKAQNIVDLYICERKIPDFITLNDFIININYEQYKL